LAEITLISGYPTYQIFYRCEIVCAFWLR